MAPSLHPPAWYPDPGNPDRIRRWNGRAWTDDVRPRPTWLRTLRLSPGPPDRVPPRGSRRLWLVSALLLGAGALVMVLMGRALPDDVGRIDDRQFASAADARCAEAQERGGTVDDWTRLVAQLRDLPVAAGDAPAVDRWLRAWDRWIDEDAARDSRAHAEVLRFAQVNGLGRCAV